MDPKLEYVTRPKFAVVGIESTGKAVDSTTWIPPLWQKAVSRFGDVKELIVGPAWGLMSSEHTYLARWTERGRYLAGWEARFESQVKAPWALWIVPETTFATVKCTMKTYVDALKYGDGTLIADGYEAAGAIHEYYPVTFQNPDTDWFFLYFSVCHRKS